MTNTLTYFRVDGAWRDIQNHIPSQSGIAPQEDDVSAYIDFFPGSEKVAYQGGLSLLLPNYETYGDTELSIAPLTARTINARLCTIAVGDPQGMELVSNASWMGLTGEDELFYHVRYRNVTYDSVLQRLSNFAFRAPVDNTGVVITSTTLERFDYRGP